MTGSGVWWGKQKSLEVSTLLNSVTILQGCRPERPDMAATNNFFGRMAFSRGPPFFRAIAILILIAGYFLTPPDHDIMTVCSTVWCQRASLFQCIVL